MLGRATLAVSVLDTKDVRAAGVLREQPIEERSAGAPDMEVAGGRGSEAYSWSDHLISKAGER
jgi:hypothetical protein